MASPLEFNEAFGSHDAHIDLLQQRIINTEAELVEAEERDLPTEEIKDRLEALKLERKEFEANTVEHEVA